MTERNLTKKECAVVQGVFEDYLFTDKTILTFGLDVARAILDGGDRAVAEIARYAEIAERDGHDYSKLKQENVTLKARVAELEGRSHKDFPKV